MTVPEHDITTLADNAPAWLTPVLFKQPFRYVVTPPYTDMAKALQSLQIERAHFLQHRTRRVDLSSDIEGLRFEITTLRRSRTTDIPSVVARGVVYARGGGPATISGYSRFGLWQVGGYFVVMVGFVLALAILLAIAGGGPPIGLTGLAVAGVMVLPVFAYTYWRVGKDRAILLEDLEAAIHGQGN